MMRAMDGSLAARNPRFTKLFGSRGKWASVRNEHCLMCLPRVMDTKLYYTVHTGHCTLEWCVDTMCKKYALNKIILKLSEHLANLPVNTLLLAASTLRSLFTA